MARVRAPVWARPHGDDSAPNYQGPARGARSLPPTTALGPGSAGPRPAGGESRRGPGDRLVRGGDRDADVAVAAGTVEHAGPGVFYGAGGDGYVRVAITATDEAVARAAARLTARGPRTG